MLMKRVSIAIVSLLVTAGIVAAASGTIVLRDGNNILKTFGVTLDGSNNSYSNFAIVDGAAATYKAAVTALGALRVNPLVEVTPVAGSAAVVTIGGTAVTLISGPAVGGWVSNPPNAAAQGIATAENLYVDLVAAPGSTDAVANGTTTVLYPGQNFVIPPIPSGITLRANAATSGHKITVVKQQ